MDQIIDFSIQNKQNKKDTFVQPLRTFGFYVIFPEENPIQKPKN